MLQLPFCFWLGQVFLQASGRGQAWQLAKGGGDRSEGQGREKVGLEWPQVNVRGG